MTTDAPLSAPMQLPHSVEAEQCILGAMMLYPSAQDAALEALSSDDFYRRTHQLIFRAIAEHVASGLEADPVTLIDWFNGNKLSDEIEHGAYLTALANDTPGASNVDGWIRIVREKAMARQLIEKCTAAADATMSGGGRDVEKTAAGLSTALASLGMSAGDAPRTFAEVGKSWVEQMHARLDTEDWPRTGLADVDARWHGLFPGNLIIVAGRPGMGKSTLAMAIAEHVSKIGWAHVFSLEMSQEELYQRRIAHDIGADKLLDPRKLDDADWARIMANVSKTRGEKVLINDEGGLHIHQIAARARAAKRKYDTQLIVVDYIQLVQGEGENRNQQIGYVTRMLKKLAKDLRIPVIGLSQLNRSLESRTDKRPLISDLRESGDIEQDADIVAMLYRERAYNENFESNVSELITRKFRNGQTGTDLIMMQPKQQNFVSPDDDLKSEYRNLIADTLAPTRGGSRFQRGGRK